MDLDTNSKKHDSDDEYKGKGKQPEKKNNYRLRTTSPVKGEPSTALSQESVIATAGISNENSFVAAMDALRKKMKQRQDEIESARAVAAFFSHGPSAEEFAAAAAKGDLPDIERLDIDKKN